MEPAKFRQQLKPLFIEHQISTVLDYGSGGGDWDSRLPGEEVSLNQYLGIDKLLQFEPARQMDDRQQAECVVCFDVLEHVFITDLPHVIFELFSLAERLVVINAACYSAAALLPNGENAHITVRNPHWWRGMCDGIAVMFPDISYQVIASPGYNKAHFFPVSSANDYNQQPNYVAL